MIELRKLDQDNVRHAMIVVTECYEREVEAGERGEDFEEDWLEANRRFTHVAMGGKYSGIVGYEGSAPVAVSLLSDSIAYDEGTGVFAWFYVSPTVSTSTFPLRLAIETIKGAKGLKEVVSFVAAGRDKLLEVNSFLGLKPVEIEMRGKVEDFPDKIKKRLE